MRKNSVKCQLCFDAEIDVVAENEEEAIDIVKANVRATIGNVYDNGCDNIEDYNVDYHGYIENVDVE